MRAAALEGEKSRVHGGLMTMGAVTGLHSLRGDSPGFQAEHCPHQPGDLGQEVVYGP